MRARLLIALVLATLGAGGPPGPAADYLLRVEFSGYDTDMPDSPPPGRLLRAVEVLVRPGEPFFGRLTVGKETTTVRGKLERKESGEFVGVLGASHLVDTGQTVPVAPGKEQKIFDTTSARSTVALKVGEPLQLGGIITRNDDQVGNEPVRHRGQKLVMKVTIREFDAAAEDGAAGRGGDVQAADR